MLNGTDLKAWWICNYDMSYLIHLVTLDLSWVFGFKLSIKTYSYLDIVISKCGNSGCCLQGLLTNLCSWLVDLLCCKLFTVNHEDVLLWRLLTLMVYSVLLELYLSLIHFCLIFSNASQEKNKNGRCFTVQLYCGAVLLLCVKLVRN